MRNTILFLVTVALLCSCSSKENHGGVVFNPDSGNIQVVLLHLDQRCNSCKSIEDETIAVMEEYFNDLLVSGELTFVALPVTSEQGKSAAKLLNASGLLFAVVKGEERIDLTSPAFMYAHADPERFRVELKEAIDKLIP